jgi:hypothetical protein
MADQKEGCNYVWVNKYSDLQYEDPKTKGDYYVDINIFVCKDCGKVKANAD